MRELYLLIICALLTSGCGEANSASETAADPGKGEEYLVAVDMVDLRGAFTLTANGFPVLIEPVFARSVDQEMAESMTAALVAGENKAGIEVAPSVVSLDGETVRAGPVHLRLWVERRDESVIEGTEVSEATVDSLFAIWERELKARWPGWLRMEDSLYAADPELEGRLWAAISDYQRPSAQVYGWGLAIDSARAWAREHPLVVTTTFERPVGADSKPLDGGPDFSALFREAPVITDTSRLKDYGAALQNLLRNNDGVGLLRELRPALDAGFLKRSVEPPSDSAYRAKWEHYARTETGWFANKVEDTSWQRGDLEARAWAGGRVWEVYRKPYKRLLGGWHVYVAEIDDELKVVRLE